MFCGWDWGSTVHGVCLLDDDGVTIKTWMVKHTGTELAAVFAELAEQGDPGLLPVAIERGEGLVVGLIARAGHPVLMVEPAAFEASRPRWGAAGAKSDATDAFMLADYARTDGHRLRRVEPLAQATRELGALVRARTSLVEARTAASNQLWAILAEDWPGAALVFHKLTSQIALAFLATTPRPGQRHGLARDACTSSAAGTVIEAASPLRSWSAGSEQRPPARIRSRTRCSRRSFAQASPRSAC
jgi:transposase